MNTRIYKNIYKIRLVALPMILKYFQIETKNYWVYIKKSAFDSRLE